MEDLDPVVLLRQTLGEYEDKISTCNLDFIKKYLKKNLLYMHMGKKHLEYFKT